MVRIVGTGEKVSHAFTYRERRSLTHHQALDVFDSRILDALAKEQHTNAGPNEQKDAERHGNEPVERRQVLGAAKDNVQRRCVNDEHA